MSPGVPAALVSSASGHQPCDGEPVLGFRIVDRVAAHECRAALGADVQAAAEDLLQHVGSEPLERERHEVERGDGPAAHRVDVRERVGGGDAAEVVRVVDDRREEVDRLYQGQLVREPVHACVVRGVGADQHVRVFRHPQRPNNRQHVARAELATATGAVRE